MDTEAIANEIVQIRNRLDEIPHREGPADTDVDDERRELEDRLRFLQGKLSSDRGDAPQDEPAAPATVHYVPPA